MQIKTQALKHYLESICNRYRKYPKIGSLVIKFASDTHNIGQISIYRCIYNKCQMLSTCIISMLIY